MDIPYKNVNDPISVKLLSDRLPNEDLSKFQILGKFAGEEEKSPFLFHSSPSLSFKEDT